MNFKKKLVIGIFILFFVSNFYFVLAQTSGVQNPGGGEIVGVMDSAICCEKTKKGLFCIDAPEEQCDTSNGLRKLQTSCSSSSFCKPGFCFDPVEGTCLDNVPQIVCNNEKGTWSATKPVQCNLGCCIVGEQGSFTTLTRCQKLSSYYGLETNFNPSVNSIEECIMIASGKEKGACIYIKNGFQRSCKMTSREDCNADNIYSGNSATKKTNQKTGDQSNYFNLGGSSGSSATPNSGNSGSGTTGNVVSAPGIDIKDGEVKFFPGKLCSAPELATDCGPSKQTTCVEGKEEVYFLDTCGNVANIYDASKINNDEYWSKIKDKAESCNPNQANENSKSCGNCNYLLGSYCRTAKTTRPTYGDNICQNLNCRDVNGKIRLHGESWCGFDVNRDFSPTKTSNANYISQLLTNALSNINSNKMIGGAFLGAQDAPVGSKFYRYLCNNGEIIVEPCSDFRQEECIEDKITTAKGSFSQAACRVNRWQDCTAQKDKIACENSDKRDCKWIDGIEYVLIGAAVNGTTMNANSIPQIRQAVREAGGIKNIPKGACVPKTAPGLKFYEGNEAQGICSQANAMCPVKYEKGLIGGDWKCVENCECLSKELELKRAQLCMSLGDCGPKVNFLGQPGNTKGYKVIEENLKKK